MRLPPWTRRLLLPTLVALSLALPPTKAGTAESYQSWPPTQWKYGNWGGGNYSNGEVGGDVWGSVLPVDGLDEVFRRHDQNYAKADRTEGAAYADAFWVAARAYLIKTRSLDDGKVRREARKAAIVKTTWNLWLKKYAAADDQAHGEASWLTTYPSGVDPQTKIVEDKKRIRWAAFKGKELLSESQRMHKRLSFLRAEELGLLNDPDRERLENDVLKRLRASLR